MLYTIVPLERIYSCRTESVIRGRRLDNDSGEMSTDVEYKRIALRHGHIYARREGEGYIVDGILSTDMADYLDKNYFPGKSIDCK
ncbi:hypothetical protein acsn021_27180 [Anaerocolumna cellulosilytica]|uniref:Uncharacterized protein n=1 Tax=Anaerocolumna cellulosilytica TaxID=433286 RepID=A0A6S6R1D8_9FIRM|nr:YlzJ-like family protein [Anaerocolumna cellulosilytica]MBB5197971.1 hypothetical protein [Anaerocolumna cellulosilytica]BCJ95149.1 hypothetical protein acsn021_27180 [Anaerocolumna cellulosilytica]